MERRLLLSQNNGRKPLLIYASSRMEKFTRGIALAGFNFLVSSKVCSSYICVYIVGAKNATCYTMQTFLLYGSPIVINEKH